MVVFTFCFWLEYPFLGKFAPKSQNYQFKQKFGTYTNWNMQNSMVMFTFLVFDCEYTFWANLVQKVKIINLRGNLVPTLIGICRIQWWSSLFFVFDQTCPFWANLIQNVKIISLSRNLVPTLFRICRIQWWCTLFVFLIRNTLFGQICFKKSKLSV